MCRSMGNFEQSETKILELIEFFFMGDGTTSIMN